MSEENKNGNGNEPIIPLIVDSYASSGLTKRELIAALAIQGMLANANDISDLNFFAELAVKQADALLKELAK